MPCASAFIREIRGLFLFASIANGRTLWFVILGGELAIAAGSFEAVGACSPEAG
jgi:hypothetical protein